ncbi:MAG TPA: gluconate 2-dehydrogenase subunit 3 family protein [Chthoniobacteraceae bacterium]|nr:gluconate 2-dehydrogenase subunit 3 family protein [Chthoniobacteraceae bacterium]
MTRSKPQPARVARELSRREAIRQILAASALASALNLRGFGAELDSPGIGFDPNLLKKEIPWPRILTAAEKRIVTALADLIIPADEFGPAASAVGVPDFIDEWVSAPYEPQVKDHKILRDGFAWIDAEATKRFSKGFADCEPAQQTAILEDIGRQGSDARKHGRDFFLLLRDRVAGGYYTTPEGWKAIGYVGNVPLAEFPGPPAEALAHIGLA